MPKRIFIRLVLPAIAGLLAGFLALAFAVPSDFKGFLYGSDSGR